MRKLIPVLIVLIGVPDLGMRAGAQTPEPKPYAGTGPFSGLKRNYVPRYSAPVDYSNSPRLDKLMRAGRIYLSLQDAIAMALENNLDIEYARFGPKLSDTDVLRASAGQLLRGSNTSIRSGPSSSSGALAGVGGVSAAGSTTSSGSGSILSGVSVQLAGSAIPNLDPQVSAQASFGHQTQMITNSFAVGVNSLVSNYQGVGYGISKGFLTGTNVSLNMSTIRQGQNSPLNDFNPGLSGNVSLTISQHLLYGFGLALNSRVIKIARNNRHSADLTFKNQVIATVANVVDLYWDLVSFDDLLKIRQQALELNQKQYEANKRRAELGAIAPIDIIQAEAEMEASQQDVTNAETQVLQQEMILKSVLTRNGLDDLRVLQARIVPTDRMEVPEQQAVEPVQDLVAQALANRPDVEQSKIGLENSRLSLMGTRNALLPTLDVFTTMTNNAYAGQMNTITLGSGATAQQILATRAAGLNTFFLGGYGSFLSQLISRKFPDYSAGFSFSVSLRNRSAQADLIRDQLTYRQQQIDDRKTQNTIKLNVVNAHTALTQAHAAYETSVKARKLQEQTLAGERRKFQLGTSNFLNVLIVQRDAVTRQAAEIQALNQYVRARNNLETWVGRVLQDHNVSLDEAYTGTVKRAPEPLPALGPGRP